MKIFPELEGLAFGLVDGIVLVLGLIIGVWAATGQVQTIILAALIGGVANAFGNSAGVLLSQTAERGIQLHERRRHRIKTQVHSKKEVVSIALFAFGAAIVTLAIMLAPFYLLGMFQATLVAAAIALILLFLLGGYVGRLTEAGQMKYGLLYAFIGLLAAVVAFAVGEGLKYFFL